MIHQYKNNGYNIVMDVNSGSVHVVDDLVYDMVAFVEPLIEGGMKDAEAIRTAVLSCMDDSHSQAEVEEAVDEVLTLYKEGQLFAPDIYENYIFDFKNCENRGHSFNFGFNITYKTFCLHNRKYDMCKKTKHNGNSASKDKN